MPLTKTRLFAASFMHPKHLSIKDFTYHLPTEKIAFQPLAKRDDSKLLVYTGTSFEISNYHQINQHLPHPAMMVFNDTKVVEARLLFKKATGATIEIFCLEPDPSIPDIVTGMSTCGSVYWHCLIGGASKWKPGQLLECTVEYQGVATTLQASFVEKRGDSFCVKFEWSPAHLSFAEILHACGKIPLPPYIKRTISKEDSNRYQTVYANTEGSVAAPTAGLHFTPELLNELKQSGIDIAYTTLHVGAGTFKPVKAATMETHEMHAEFIDVNRSLIEQLLENSAPLIAVGTTSMRTLESIYWIGEKLVKNPDTSHNNIALDQWVAYENNAGMSAKSDALKAILNWMDRYQTNRLLTTTQIIIAPGYSFKMVDYLVTNFHQPESTLLLLVAAFIGPRWKEVYEFALENEFRFLSYGDGCLFKRSDLATTETLK